MRASSRRFSVPAVGVTTLIQLAWAVALSAQPTVPRPMAPEPTVAAIEVRAEAELASRLDWPNLISFAVGDRLTEAVVRRTLENLHATGLVADAAVYRRPGDGGAVAVVAAWGFTWVEAVRIRGAEGLDRKALRRRAAQNLNRPLTEDATREIATALKKDLAARGYHDASVTPSVVRAALVLDVDAGPRAIIGAVSVAGDLAPFDTATLVSELGLESGEPLEPRTLEAARDRLRHWLVARGYLQATVALPSDVVGDDPMHPVMGRTALAFPVEIGPRVEVEISALGGEVSRRRLERAGLLPFLREGGYDAALLRQTCGRMRENFQRRGHYRVRVRCEERLEDDRLTVSIDLDLGPRFRVSGVRFEGNAWASDADLRSLVGAGPRRALRSSSGRLVDTELGGDLDNLRSFYLLQGFSEVEVGPARVDVDAEDRSLGVVIPIHEGPRQRVVSLTIAGAHQIEPARLLEDLPLFPGGGPFHPALLEESTALIRARYGRQGWSEATVTPELVWTEDGRLVDVHLVVDEGRRAILDHLVLRGQRRTRAALIERTVGLEPGDVLAPQRLLEAERDLYKLGIFSRVSVNEEPIASDDGRQNVVVSVEEGRRWRIGYGAGYHSDDGLGAVLSISRANLGGRGDRLRLDLRANEVEQRYRLILEQPSATGLGLPLTYTLFFAQEDRDAFGAIDRGFQVAFAEDRRRSRWGVVYDYRLVDLSEDTPDPGDIDRTRAEIQISSLTPSLYIDRRDDPVEPRRGWSDLLQLTWAFPLITADASFVELFWQHTHVRPLGRFGVLAASLRFGAIEPIGDGGIVPDSLVPGSLPSAFVPISERFFAGGRTSHRAFERDALGIEDETLVSGVPIGGNGLALLNLDYRFPIAGTVGGVVFFDTGNVWADWRDIDPGDARPGAGIGIRYRSPIGPLRLEVGWNLDRRSGDDSPVLFLSFGNPF